MIMKKFICKVGLFFLIIATIDWLFGFTMGTIVKRTNIGGTGKDNFICDKMTDDVLIFGSSRAEQHYNAQMISDSLGVSCYNAGECGYGIIHAYGHLLMALERYSPKTIIYEVTPKFDYLAEGDNYRSLYRLKQHYDRAGIDSIFWDVDPKERYKMTSGMYRHNSSFLQNLVVYFLRISAGNGIKGFRPLHGEMDTMKIRADWNRKAYDSSNGYVYDSLKIRYFNKFLEKTKNIELIFVVSPTWYGQDTLVLEPIKEICKTTGARLVDFSNDPKYIHENRYFSDAMHLNARGADEFTRDLIRELRKKFITESKEKTIPTGIGRECPSDVGAKNVVSWK